MTADRPLLFLVGFMGSGKSTVGRLLAEATSRAFIDTDALVAEREGRSIGQIFSESGEGYFRGVEQGALESLVGQPPSIVATGGGLFLGTAQRRFMREHGLTVWLDASISTCRARVGDDPDRPVWRSRDAIGLRALFEKRRAAYALAGLRVPADGAPQDVLRELLGRLPAIFR